MYLMFNLRTPLPPLQQRSFLHAEDDATLLRLRIKEARRMRANIGSTTWRQTYREYHSEAAMKH